MEGEREMREREEREDREVASNFDSPCDETEDDCDRNVWQEGAREGTRVP